MASRADQFREKADECRALAARAKDRVAKQHFEDIAQQWLELARQVERIDKR